LGFIELLSNVTSCDVSKLSPSFRFQQFEAFVERTKELDQQPDENKNS
jgi:predicted cupin superfamily sugar epimerase